MLLRSKKLLIIILCCNLLVPIVHANRRIVFIEKFENTIDGGLPKGWTKKASATAYDGSANIDEVSVGMDYASQGKKSLKLRELSDGSSSWVHSPLFKTHIKEDFEVSFSFKIQGGASARAVFVLYDERENKAIGVNCRLGDDWRYSCAQSLWMEIPGLPTPKAGKEYRITIHIDTQTDQMCIEINGVESEWVPIWTGWKYITKIGFHNNEYHPSEYWIDELKIREIRVKK